MSIGFLKKYLDFAIFVKTAQKKQRGIDTLHNGCTVQLQKVWALRRRAERKGCFEGTHIVWGAIGRCAWGKEKAGEVGSSAFEVCFVLRAAIPF